MPVDMGSMKKSHKEQQKGGDFGNFEQGETLIYVCPPCREEDPYEPTKGLVYVPITMHYRIGAKEGVAASLDPNENPIMKHPFVRRELKRAGKLAKIDELEGKCPIQKAIQSGKIEDPDESRAQTRYLWNFIPLQYRKSTSDEWMKLTPKTTTFMIGRSIYEGIMEAFFDNGDITDPNQAVLIRVLRKGMKLSTKYTIKVAPETLKKPFVLGPKLKAAMLKDLGGDADLFKIAAGLFKSPVEIAAMLKGLKTTSDPDDDVDEDEEDDEEELEKAKKSRKKAPPADDDEDEDADDEADDEDEDEEPAPKKKAKKPVEDDEEEEEPAPKKKAKKPADDDEEADEDDEPAPKKKAKKPADDEEADEDDEDEDEEPAPKKKAKKPEPEDDDEEPAPKKKAKKPAEDEDEEPAPKKKSKKGDAKTDESEDVEGLDDLEKELAELDAKPKKKAKKKPADEDEDDE